MRYADFDKLIHDMAGSASDSARRAFALDTIVRLHASAERAIREEFTDLERLILSEIVAGLERLPVESLKRKILELSDVQCEDEIRAMEFDPKATDLVSALYDWAEYRITNDPAFIARIAITMVDAIDYEIVGQREGYSSENVLGAPEMVAEHHRQNRMLLGAE
jgi:hypothetical protein